MSLTVIDKSQITDTKSSLNEDIYSDGRTVSSSRKSSSLTVRPEYRKPEENPPMKKTEQEEDNNFKSAFSPRLQTDSASATSLWSQILG
jgi:hypothetical protein